MKKSYPEKTIEILNSNIARVYLKKISPFWKPDIGKKQISDIGLLNDALGNAFQLQVSEKEIYFSAEGKPYIQWNTDHVSRPSIYFNLSHSYDYVICTLSNLEIGCDIQRIKTVPVNLHRYLMQMSSILDLEHQINWQDIKDQTKMWTMYEALGKCLGTGIPISERDLREADRKKYCFEEIHEVNGYCISVVTVRPFG